MRKIVSKEQGEKKRKRNQLIVGGILVLIMILSTVGYAFTQNEKSTGAGKKITYKGIDFVQQNDYWFATIGGAQFAFKYNPQETEEINGIMTIGINSYSGKPLYISSDNFDAEAELYRNLDSIILRRQYACLEGETCNKEYPVKNCTDNLIIIKKAEQNSISQQENCVFIEGIKNETVKLVDKFLYKALGIQ